MLFEITPKTVTAIIRAFSRAAADIPSGTSRTSYEKVFVMNNTTAAALTGANLQISSDAPSLPSGALLDIALCTALTERTRSPINRPRLPREPGAFVT
jgi:hypothetical protein